MNYVIFDIDGTLTQSTDFDAACFKRAVLEHSEVRFKAHWGEYEHVTDSGLVKEIIHSHGLNEHERHLTDGIKRSFLRNVRSYISRNPVKEVPGAGRFIKTLNERTDVRVGIATGGWSETALLKLESAGAELDGISLSSANDAISRVDIMKQALVEAGEKNPTKVSYFGDASWDKRACEKLGWNFIAVGNEVEHHQRIESFDQATEALRFCFL